MEYRSSAYTGLAEIAVMEKNIERAFKYAALAQDYNRYDVKAIQLEAVTSRLAGRTQQAASALSRLTAMDPLNHFAGFEQYLANPVAEKLAAFKSMIRNEFPEQTYLELAIFYFNLNLAKEAAAVLNEAPDQMEVRYWKAFLSRQSPELLPTKFVFPYRPESMRVIEWAESVKPAWQNRYFLGLIRLSLDDSAKAKELFKSCQNEPAESHFYLTRAKLFEGSDDGLALGDIKKAVDLEPGDWRSWHALGAFYARTRDWAEYQDVCRKATSKIPNHMILEFDQAKAELYNRSYDKSIEILGNLILLPAEGAREGHEIYRSALILRALDYFTQKRYLKALTDIEEARKWPETLGVGRPYVTDERIEDYLSGLCYLQMNQAAESEKYFMKVIDYTKVQQPAWDSPYLLAAQCYKLLSKEDDGDHLLTGWMKSQPASALMMWTVAVYTDNKPAAEKALQRLGWKPEESPWGVGDSQLALVYEIMTKVKLR